MFYVFGTQGPLFRGSMEQLRQVRGITALARTRGLPSSQMQGAEADTRQPFPQHPAEPLSARPDTQPARAPAADAWDAPSASTLAQGWAEAARAALSAYATPAVPRQPLRWVRDVMTQPVMTVAQSQTVWQAWQQLAQAGVGQAPVLDSAGRLVGLLTRADLMRLDRLPGPDQPALAWRAWMQQTVASAMLSPTPSVAPEADLRRLARVLLDTGLPGLPVTDEAGAVVGFASRSDILRAVVTDPPLDLWG